MTKGAGFSLKAVILSPLSSGDNALAAGALEAAVVTMGGGTAISRMSAEVCSTFTVVPGFAGKLDVTGAEDNRSVGRVGISLISGNLARNSGDRGAIPERWTGGKVGSGGNPKNIRRQKQACSLHV